MIKNVGLGILEIFSSLVDDAKLFVSSPKEYWRNDEGGRNPLINTCLWLALIGGIIAIIIEAKK